MVEPNGRVAMVVRSRVVEDLPRLAVCALSFVSREMVNHSIEQLIQVRMLDQLSIAVGRLWCDCYLLPLRCKKPDIIVPLTLRLCRGIVYGRMTACEVVLDKLLSELLVRRDRRDVQHSRF